MFARSGTSAVNFLLPNVLQDQVVRVSQAQIYRLSADIFFSWKRVLYSMHLSSENNLRLLFFILWKQ